MSDSSITQLLEFFEERGLTPVVLKHLSKDYKQDPVLHGGVVTERGMVALCDRGSPKPRSVRVARWDDLPARPCRQCDRQYTSNIRRGKSPDGN